MSENRFSYISLVREFLTALRLRRDASTHTVRQYALHLFRFFVFLSPGIRSVRECDTPVSSQYLFLDMQTEECINRYERDFPLDITALTRENIERFRLSLHETGISIRTANAYIITIRSFLKFLKKEGYAVLDPTSLELVRAPSRQVSFLTLDEVGRLFSTAEGDDIRSVRDRAILECIYSTGLRVSELVSLDRARVDLARREFAVRGKWKKLRTVYLSPGAVERISRYLDMRDDVFSPLFIRHNFDTKNIKNAHLDDESVRLTRAFITQMVKRYALQANIIKTVSAHTLRHSFATTLLQNGADLRAIQEMLWHASILTTQVYTHVTNPKLREVHERFFSSDGESAH